MDIEVVTDRETRLERAWLNAKRETIRQADLIAKVQNGGQLICPGKHEGEG